MGVYGRLRFSSRWYAVLALAMLAAQVAAPFAPLAQSAELTQVAPGCEPLPVPRAADGWPAAVNDSLGSVPRASITFSGATLLANDRGAALSIVSVGPSSAGNGTVTGTGPYTFTFAAGFAGTDVFPYEITDTAGQTAVGLVRVTATGDTVFPTVSITAPAAGASLAGSVVLSASATDNIGVAGVRFFDGATPVGPEILAAPFETTWNTTLVTDGNHSLTAVARDAAGNASTSAAVPVIVANGQAQGEVNANLVLALAFNETSGTTATDASGRGNNGAISGATRTTGRFGGALSFDGVDDWVTVADAASLDLTSGMTLEAWVKPSTLGGWRTAILKETTGGLAYALYGNDDVPRPASYVNVGGLDQSVPGTAALSTTDWTHLAATFDGATLRLYVNGALTNSNAVAGQLITTTGALRIGGNSVWGEYFAGLIDEVRVYDRPLSAAEIGADMTKAIGGGAPAMTTVPALAGLTRSAAEAAIASANLVVGGVTEAYNDAVPAGNVFAQNPPAGQSVPTGSAVTFSVSLGSAPTNPGGLVLALSFDEASGTVAADASGKGNNGTLSGATRTAGKFGGALSFNGTSDWVTVADAASLDLTSGMTLEAWVKPSAATDWRTAVLKETTGGLAYALYANTDASAPGAFINLGGLDQSAVGAAPLSTTDWTHVAATYDGAMLRLYVNGAFTNAVALSGAIVQSAGPLRIGGNSVWGEFFAGLIDEVRVYDRALTAGEIATDMNTSISGAAGADNQQLAGPVLALSFNEEAGATATDSSGNGNHGTLAGATRTTAGKFGGGVSFNGISDVVTVADAASLDLTSGMTLEAWVQPSAATDWRTAILKETAGGLAYALYAHTDASAPGAFINLGALDQAATGIGAISTTDWTHLAATFDGATLRLYVNGVLVRSVALNGSIVTSAGALRIGGNSVWGEFFAGLIDEVRVYNRALTAEQITADMNAPIGLQ